MQSASSLDDLMDTWEKKLGAMGDPGSTIDAFLDLGAHDMRNAASNIDCPFCRRHMMLEAGEITQVLDTIRSEGNRPHSHGIGERLGTLVKSFEIVANVLLGGLRRAGIV